MRALCERIRPKKKTLNRNLKKTSYNPLPVIAFQEVGSMQLSWVRSAPCLHIHALRLKHVDIAAYLLLLHLIPFIAIRRNALPCLMFLKRNRCGKVKGRGCADGRGQMEFISKDEASSPTASLCAIILTAMLKFCRSIG